MRYVLALDQGTTSSRAIVFDEEGRAVASAQREFAQHYPQPGWVEHDPREIYSTQRDTAREAMRKANVPLKELMAVGITNQRETTLLWDRQSGEPLHPAIVWQDRRTAPMCDELRAAGAESLVRERTGLVIDPYFSGTKLAWLLDNVPGLRAQMIETLKQYGIQMSDLPTPGVPMAASSSAPAAGASSSEEDPVAKLEKLSALHKQGVLTDEEFQAAKAKVLGEL